MSGAVSKLSFQGFKKMWELWPLGFCVSFGMGLVLGSTVWQLNSRDIMFNRRRRPINERVDLLAPRALKLLIVDPEAGPMPLPELHDVYRAMDAELEDREREAEARRRAQKKRS